VPVGAAGDGPWALIDDRGTLLAVYEATGTDRSSRLSYSPVTDVYPQPRCPELPSPSVPMTVWHLGHRALLADLVARAEAAGLSPVVVTFDRHPASVVRPESAPPLLTILEQKLELLADAASSGPWWCLRPGPGRRIGRGLRP